MREIAYGFMLVWYNMPSYMTSLNLPVSCGCAILRMR